MKNIDKCVEEQYDELNTAFGKEELCNSKTRVFKGKTYFYFVVFLCLMSTWDLSAQCTNNPRAVNWSDYPASKTWCGSGDWSCNGREYAIYNGYIYTPNYSSTTAPLSDPWNRGKSTTFWGRGVKCETCIAPSPGSVSGASSVCDGTSTTFTTNITSGGSWSSSNASVATVSSSGVVTGQNPGTATITYTITDCDVTQSGSRNITVHAPANAGTLSGNTTICENRGTTTLSSNGSVGGTWTSSNKSVAIVNSSTGLVTAMGVGSTTITYLVTASSPCLGTDQVSTTVTVTSAPNAGTLSGVSTICEDGGTTTVVSSGDAGSWSTSDAGVATVNPSTGLVTAVSSGTSTLTYRVSATSPCTAAATETMLITVQAAPDAGTLSGTSTICEDGGTTTLVSSGDAGSWSTSEAGVATVNSSTGLVTAVSSGTSTLTYRVSATSPCTVAATETKLITVQAAPDAGTLSGTSTICEDGGTTTVVSSGDAGSWSTSDAGVATVNPSTGLVTAVSSGTSTLTYRVSATSPCTAAATETMLITVQAAPDAGTLSGTSTICEDGGTTTLVSSGDAGSWSTSEAGVATVNSSTGLVTAVSSGTSTLTYRVSATSPCTAAATETMLITVQEEPNAGIVSAVVDICQGSIVNETQLVGALTNQDIGGVWSPALLGAGEYIYSVPATFPCLVEDTTKVIVIETTYPSSGDSRDTVLCSVDGDFDLNLLLVDNNRIGTWSPSSSFNSSQDMPGEFVYTTLGQGVCASEIDRDTVFVGRDIAPNAGVLSDTSVCTGDAILSLVPMLQNSDVNGTWGRSVMFDPSTEFSGNISYTVTGTGACSNEVSNTSAFITVYESPRVNVMNSFDGISVCPQVSGKTYDVIANTTFSNSITWSTIGSARLLSNNEDTVCISFPNQMDTTYIIATVGSDNCFGSTSDTLMIAVDTSYKVDYSVIGDTVCLHDDVKYEITNSLGSFGENASYTWFFNHLDTISATSYVIVSEVGENDELELFVQTDFCSDTTSQTTFHMDIPYVLRPGAELLISGERDHHLDINTVLDNVKVELEDYTDRSHSGYTEPVSWSFYWMSDDHHLIHEGEQGVIDNPVITNNPIMTIATPPMKDYNIYTVDYYMVTSNGVCMDTSIAHLNLRITSFVPNVFTPNGDDHFDTWGIENNDAFGQLGLKIYNRWGSLVYSSDDWDNAWHGENNDGEKLPVGTYFYIIEMLASGEKYDGDVTIFR